MRQIKGFIPNCVLNNHIKLLCPREMPAEYFGEVPHRVRDKFGQL